jgi:hypothetical protein
MIGPALLLACASCWSDRPHEYGKDRPPVDQIDSRDKGLQSKEVVAATDKLAMDLLSLPELNQSAQQWTMVVTNVENHTSDPRFNYDIFIERLRGPTGAARQGPDRADREPRPATGTSV